MRERDVLAHAPGQRLLVQRQVADVGVVDVEGLLDQRVALRLVGLRLDRLCHLVELGVAVGAQVELAGPGVRRARGERVQRVVGVVRGGGPAEHVEARVAPQDLREIGAFGLGLQIDLDADARQVRADRLADVGVVHIAVVRAVHRHLEALRIARFGHQFFGAFHVIRQPLVLVGGEAVDARADQQGRR